MIVHAWTVLCTAVLAALLALTGCSDGGDRTGRGASDPAERLVVLAGSEIKDLEAPLREAARRAGIDL